jgi:hypothetical protein
LNDARGRVRVSTGGKTPRVAAHGFSLHAGERCDAHQRKEFERLCRYISPARPLPMNGSNAIQQEPRSYR